MRRRIGSGRATLTAIVLVLSGCSSAGETPTPTATTAPSERPTASAAGPCPTAGAQTVTDAAELKAALAKAGPGSVIRLARGVFLGQFVLSARGTPTQPVWLCGLPGSVLDGGGTDHGYVLHLDRVSDARLTGFTVREGQKGIVADQTTGTSIEGLTVTRIGDEGIHLRRDSIDNTIAGNTVTGTGLRKAKFGEGIYIGSAQSNWCEQTACRPDRSDGNTVRDNTISGTAAESIDVKEGTSGGQLLGNRFDGTGMSGADSWVDVKGNGWTVSGNAGVHAPVDGFQTHQVVDGWGTGNVFAGNTAQVDASGFGFHFAPPLANRLACDNTATGAAKGLANVDCG